MSRWAWPLPWRRALALLVAFAAASLLAGIITANNGATLAGAGGIGLASMVFVGGRVANSGEDPPDVAP